ncbi:unnamed protein product [Parnassius mnemosyne]|uniref:Endonuclease/exonuclease/phosphatase domain-containing protein n=1 Tax=Parnassius mnemosyne TaxID=213953 RepID=A0AAV1M112_9NEOP
MYEDMRSLATEKVFKCCGISLSGEKLLVLCIYRTPESDISIFFEKFEKLLLKVSYKNNFKTVICGDFNIDLLPNAKNHTISYQFNEIISSYNFSPMISEPTRITKVAKTCIDNILCNFKGGILSIYELKLSDHTRKSLSIPLIRRQNVKFWFTYRRDNISYSEVISEQVNVNIAYNSFHYSNCGHADITLKAYVVELEEATSLTTAAALQCLGTHSRVIDKRQQLVVNKAKAALLRHYQNIILVNRTVAA